MTDSLYDSDILLWSQQQAELLRQGRISELDLENVIEEIEDVGKNILRAVRSHIIQAFLHDLKAQAWPNSRDVEHWKAEARLHRDEARDDYSPSMAQHIDLDKLYSRALRGLPEAMDGAAGLPVPRTCPFTLAKMFPDAD